MRFNENSCLEGKIFRFPLKLLDDWNCSTVSNSDM
jgi:hypothetical protein